VAWFTRCGNPLLVCLIDCPSCVQIVLNWIQIRLRAFPSFPKPFLLCHSRFPKPYLPCPSRFPKAVFTLYFSLSQSRIYLALLAFPSRIYLVLLAFPSHIYPALLAWPLNGLEAQSSVSSRSCALNGIHSSALKTAAEGPLAGLY
jgi:hypothetical protein